jgi:hypothetical protein
MKKVYYFLYGFLKTIPIFNLFWLLYLCNKIIENGTFKQHEWPIVVTALGHAIAYFMLLIVKFAIYLKERK